MRNPLHADEQDALALTVKDVAALLKVSPRHVAALNASGRLPSPVRLGRSVRWGRDELREWLASGAPSRDRWEAMQQGRRG